MTKEDRKQKISNILLRLDTNTYEYYPLVVKKPSKLVKLKKEYVHAFDALFKIVGAENTMEDQEYDYIVTISLDKQEDILLVLINISEKDNKTPPLIDYNLFFYKELEEKKLFLNFIYNYNIIFEPHECNVLLFDGKTKYKDKEFIEVQRKWITQLSPT